MHDGHSIQVQVHASGAHSGAHAPFLAGQGPSGGQQDHEGQQQGSAG